MCQQSPLQGNHQQETAAQLTEVECEEGSVYRLDIVKLHKKHCPLRAGNSATLTFEAVKAVGGLAPTRDLKLVKVNTLPSTLVTFGDTTKSEIISACISGY